MSRLNASSNFFVASRCQICQFVQLIKLSKYFPDDSPNECLDNGLEYIGASRHEVKSSLSNLGLGIVGSKAISSTPTFG